MKIEQTLKKIIILPFAKKVSHPGFERTYSGGGKKIRKWQPRGIWMTGSYSHYPECLAAPKKINNNDSRFYIIIRIGSYILYLYSIKITANYK